MDMKTLTGFRVNRKRKERLEISSDPFSPVPSTPMLTHIAFPQRGMSLSHPTSGIWSTQGYWLPCSELSQLGLGTEEAWLLG